MNRPIFKQGDWVSRISTGESGQIIWINQYELMIRFDDRREVMRWWTLNDRFMLEEAEIPL